MIAVPSILIVIPKGELHRTTYIGGDTHERIVMIFSDAFIALPGGIGTLDEIFTVAASKTIGYHGRPVILFNINGCWDALTTLLDDLQQRGLMRGSWRSHFIVADSLDDIQKALS